MKNERLFKTFSALAHYGIAVNGERVPVSSVSLPRLTPESVQNFDVPQDGFTDSDLSQQERSGRPGPGRGGARVDRAMPDSAQTAAQKAGHPDAAASSEVFRQMLRQRFTAPYVSAIPHHRWGINE